MQRNRGKLIVIEGLDQSGKRTQTRLLAGRLRSIGHPCSIWNFPDYRTPLGRQLKAYLTGRNPLNFHAVHMLYAANRWERAAEITHEIRRGRSVIVNRYSQSNLAYGIAHGLSLDWLVSLEEDLPTADVVLVLDVSPQASFSRKSRFRDVHEGDPAYLKNVRKAYMRLAKRFRWKVIDGERDFKVVHSDLWRQVSPVLRDKSRRR